MIPIFIFIAIVAIGVLIYFKNKVENRRIDRINKQAERQERLMEILKEKNTEEDEN